jgi:hypothetical protein
MNITSFKSKDYRTELPLRPAAKQNQTNPISNPTHFTQITQFTVVSVHLIHPAEEVELIKKGIFPEMFFTAYTFIQEQFVMLMLTLLIIGSFQISPDNCCCRERFFSIAVLNCHRNLNTLNVGKAVGRVNICGFCKNHSRYIIAQQITVAGRIVNLVKFVVGVVILISYTRVIESTPKSAFVVRSARVNGVSGPQLSCYAEQCLTPVIDGLEDILVCLITHNRGIKSHSHSRKQQTRYGKSNQNFGKGKTVAQSGRFI